jgi:hypothetical protein
MTVTAGSGRCPACGGQNPAGSVACSWCGQALPLPTGPNPPPLDFTRPPDRPFDYAEPAEETSEGSDEDSDEEDDDTYWTVGRVVRWILAAILVILLILELAKGG